MFKPIPLKLPPYPIQISTDGKRHYIFDELRRKHLVWTPEEWVRQHWIHHLIQVKKYPKGLLKPESGLHLHGMPRRSDLLAYNAAGNMVLLAEFKSPNVSINTSVFEQVSRYNSVYRIPLLLVSNGLIHYCWKIDFEHGSYEFLEELPLFEH